MGHSSTRAALIYQHATSDRDRAIAAALGTLAEQELKAARRRHDGKNERPTEAQE